jgi:hypothetical protein
MIAFPNKEAYLIESMLPFSMPESLEIKGSAFQA